MSSDLEGIAYERPELTAIKHVLDMSNEQFFAQFLKIRTKTQGIKPFLFNKGQLYIDAMAERQLSLKGHVRICLLKARQWGGSTYVQGRFYRRITQGKRGMRAFILTQDAEATSNIFGMTRRFHELMDKRFKPYCDRSATTHMYFPKRDSSYGVATAGGKAIARSQTLQLFHGSEVAFWPNAQDHFSGALSAVPPEGEGTEIWLESTAQGMGNTWHQTCQLSRAGRNEYEFAFVPWFWFPEYSREQIPQDMVLTPDDEDYMLVHGLTEQQMAFRHMKIQGFGGGESAIIQFGQEFPATPEEAFATNVTGSFIPAMLFLKARRNTTLNPYGLRLMGIDPAWQGGDRFTIKMRQGRVAWSPRNGQWQHERTLQSLGRTFEIIKRERPDVIFVDANGVGAGYADTLEELCRPLFIPVILVLGGEGADDENRFKNKRQECWGRMLDWYQQAGGVRVYDEAGEEAKLDEWQADTTNPRKDYGPNGEVIVESAQKIKARGDPSPDNSSALSQTFAMNIDPTVLDQMRANMRDRDEDRPAVDARFA